MQVSTFSCSVPVQSLRTSTHVRFGLDLPSLPSRVPPSVLSRQSIIMPCCVSRYVTRSSNRGLHLSVFRFVMIAVSFTPILCCIFVGWEVQLIFNIILQHHISEASMLCSIDFESVIVVSGGSCSPIFGEANSGQLTLFYLNQFCSTLGVLVTTPPVPFTSILIISQDIKRQEYTTGSHHNHYTNKAIEPVFIKPRLNIPSPQHSAV